MARYPKNFKNLNEKEENFCKLYVKYGIGYKAFIEAFPERAKWTRESIDPACSRLLKKTRILTRIDELNTIKNRALEKSITLNKKKLINEAIELFSKCKESPAQYANAINLLKMLFNKEGLNNDGTSVQVNINNAPILNEITNYLDI